MKPNDLLALLREFFADARALRERHEANARRVRQYDANNTYQYIVSREDGHLSWLREAITSAGGEAPDAPPGRSPERRATGPDAGAGIARDDARETEAFIGRWHERCRGITHARHRRMLDVILGEAREHQRFFDQAAAGRTDLLGRRPSGSGTRGDVMPARWVE